jgi:hypothetical protein
MLVVWNQGPGWKSDDLYPRVHDVNPMKGPIFRMTQRQRRWQNTVRQIAWDDCTDDFLDTSSLCMALSRAKETTDTRLDVIGLDSCIGATIEGARQLAPYADYLVASVAGESAIGWPYSKILEELNAHPGMSPADLAVMLGAKYDESDSSRRLIDEAGTPVVVSLARTAKTEELCRALVDGIVSDSSERLRYFVGAVSRRLPKSERQSYRDLGGFAARLSVALAGEGYRDVVQAASALYQHLRPRSQETPILKMGDVCSDSSATGMQVYLPSKGLPADRTLSAHRQLRFPQRTGWNRFVEWMLKD